MDKIPVPIKVDATLKGNLADVTKLGGKIVDTIAKACGVVYQPVDTLLTAKAEARAQVIKAQAEIEVDELLARAKDRFISQQLRQQSNVDSIVRRSIVHAGAGAATSTNCDPDWINEFLDCSKNVSDEQMQELLAKILAGEVANPGAYSRRATNFVKTLSKSELHLFSRVGSYVWSTGGRSLFIPHDGIGLEYGYTEEPTFSDIQDCQSLGLLHSSATYTFRTGSKLIFQAQEYSVAAKKQLGVSAYPLSRVAVELINAIPIHPLPTSPWCWLQRWNSSLNPFDTVMPPKTKRIKDKELPNISEEELQANHNAISKEIDFWLLPDDTSPEELNRLNTRYRYEQIRTISEYYMLLRKEILKRHPELAEQLPPIELKGDAD